MRCRCRIWFRMVGYRCHLGYRGSCSLSSLWTNQRHCHDRVRHGVVAWSGIIGSDNSGVKGRTPYSAALELHHDKMWLEENLDNNCEANFPFLSSPPVTANCRPAGVDRRSSSDKFLPETVETIGRVAIVRINYCQVNRENKYYSDIFIIK